MIRIAKVEWDFNYAWQDIRGLSSWSALRLNSALWHGLLMTTKVGQPMTISVTITEDNWDYIKTAQPTWGSVKDNFTSWQKVKEA